jgi:hypothetical protein
MGSKSPWHVPTYNKPWHDHLDMTSSTSLIMSKSYAPNNVMLFSKVSW